VIHFFSELESKEVLQSYLQVMKQLIERDKAQATAYRHLLKIAVKLAQREGEGDAEVAVEIITFLKGAIDDPEIGNDFVQKAMSSQVALIQQLVSEQ
jgi:hypothetical protein